MFVEYNFIQARCAPQKVKTITKDCCTTTGNHSALLWNLNFDLITIGIKYKTHVYTLSIVYFFGMYTTPCTNMLFTDTNIGAAFLFF